MIKYFYLVNFTYKSNDNEEKMFLGIFSTVKKARLKIELCQSLQGFNNYAFDNYKIIKFGVNIQTSNFEKKNAILYCVMHEYFNSIDEFYYWNIFDYYVSKTEAMNKIKYLRKHSRVGKRYPHNFKIDSIKVDDFSNWSEGFVYNS